MNLDFDESFHLGLAATQRSDFGKAIEHFKHCLMLGQDEGRVYHMLGACYAQIGLYERAKENFTEAVTRDPEQQVAAFQLGLLQLTSGNVTAAYDAWATLETLEDAHPLRLFIAGLRALVADQFDHCVELINEGIAANAANPALNSDMQRVVDAARAAISPDAERPATGLNSTLLANYQKQTEKKH
jgi:tetratricopeptide (TPR) repeat protein